MLQHIIDVAKAIFKTDGATLAGLWEKCERETDTDNFLAVLNEATTKEFRFGLTARLWKPDGAGNERVQVQVHVQWAEEL